MVALFVVVEQLNPGESRDAHGRQQFHLGSFDTVWKVKFDWLDDYDKYETKSVSRQLLG